MAPGTRRSLMAYLAAVVASTLGATAGLAFYGFVVWGGGNPAELGGVLAFTAAFSVVFVAILGPLGLAILRALKLETRAGFAAAGLLLGLFGGAAIVSFDLVLGAPFVVAGTLAGLLAALTHRAVAGRAAP